MKLVIAACLALLAIMVFSIIVYANGNVQVRYYDGIAAEENGGSLIGFGPCEANKLSNRDDIIFVFTEPFASLDEFQSAAVVKKVAINDGAGSTSLIPGNYGLYLEYANGDKRLYDDLSLGNARKDIPRDQQGPWYVSVNLYRSVFGFKEKFPC